MALEAPQRDLPFWLISQDMQGGVGEGVGDEGPEGVETIEPPGSAAAVAAAASVAAAGRDGVAPRPADRGRNGGSGGGRNIPGLDPVAQTTRHGGGSSSNAYRRREATEFRGVTRTRGTNSGVEKFDVQFVFCDRGSKKHPKIYGFATAEDAARAFDLLTCRRTLEKAGGAAVAGASGQPSSGADGDPGGPARRALLECSLSGTNHPPASYAADAGLADELCAISRDDLIYALKQCAKRGHSLSPPHTLARLREGIEAARIEAESRARMGEPRQSYEAAADGAAGGKRRRAGGGGGGGDAAAPGLGRHGSPRGGPGGDRRGGQARGDGQVHIYAHHARSPRGDPDAGPGATGPTNPVGERGSTLADPAGALGPPSGPPGVHGPLSTYDAPDLHAGGYGGDPLQAALGHHPGGMGPLGHLPPLGAQPGGPLSGMGTQPGGSLSGMGARPTHNVETGQATYLPAPHTLSAAVAQSAAAGAALLQHQAAAAAAYGLVGGLGAGLGAALYGSPDATTMAGIHPGLFLHLLQGGGLAGVVGGLAVGDERVGQAQAHRPPEDGGAGGQPARPPSRDGLEGAAAARDRAPPPPDGPAGAPSSHTPTPGTLHPRPPSQSSVPALTYSLAAPGVPRALGGLPPAAAQPPLPPSTGDAPATGAPSLPGEGVPSGASGVGAVDPSDPALDAAFLFEVTRSAAAGSSEFAAAHDLVRLWIALKRNARLRERRAGGESERQEGGATAGAGEPSAAPGAGGGTASAGPRELEEPPRDGASPPAPSGAGLRGAPAPEGASPGSSPIPEGPAPGSPPSALLSAVAATAEATGLGPIHWAYQAFVPGLLSCADAASLSPFLAGLWGGGTLRALCQAAAGARFEDVEEGAVPGAGAGDAATPGAAAPAGAAAAGAGAIGEEAGATAAPAGRTAAVPSAPAG